MKSRTSGQRLRSTLVTAAVAIVFEAALRRMLAAGDVVAVLFAGGGSAHPGLVALAVAFVAVRLVTFLLLPGLVARDLVRLLLDRAGRSAPQG